ncbi:MULTISPECIES: multidrug efflux RND transporter permease subunit [unclassified Chelatococcus]|uniref:multidrug efflux RND transporter permease subunit n=1 Tax=unclassified Chelatococcus TaxID=2638111 RepID=UPI001BCB6BCE|nr:MULTISPECIES: multidrug efflux RND transporter permease subunit [unclassified Chelatococcus]CAH1648056.1 multidrug efflux pump RND permease subunit MdtB [Hyphomicrobiales bacterium]MBS7742082.1 multidrug efflux RND transporter permease subunit [Chelatococcus sp. HY11]MBX3541120.1 multidrug efflux RND transporter permease subunit [Chelatococcus sp.]MCO5074985.1 multidrug efflux RND transporter permease subunit [Chelatococcus sp.]CAH1690278.1 multidrug efflux pump RND permease subunit MdtB [H
MNISAPFITRPVMTTLLMAAVLMLGVVAYPLLPVAPLPQIDFPTIQISARLPGASPDVMASSVAAPLERQFGQIAGITQMTSTSTLGSTSITIQFALDRNIDAAAQDVQAAITAAQRQLPDDLTSPPSYRKVNPADSPIMILAAHSDTLPLTDVDDAADNVLAQRLSQVEGVSQVVIGGEQKPAIRVQVDPAKLAGTGLTLEDVHATLANATAEAPKGVVNGAVRSFTIAANDQITKPEDYDDVILAYREGAPIRVRDVGHAVVGPENTDVAAWQNDRRAVVLLVFKQPGANVIATIDAIKATLPLLDNVLPAGIKVDTVVDRSVTIRASVADVQFTLVLTIALVVLVILLFLRNLRATAIPAVVVPLSFAGSAAVMYALGFSIDNLSLMALTIAVGFVVDDAIVVVENIVRHMEDGQDAFTAAMSGAREIGFTVLSISLSLVAVFIPLLLMGGIVGRLFREFALTVTAAIAVSVFISLTLTPMLCSRFLKPPSHTHGRLYRLIEGGFDAILGFYISTLDIALRYRRVTLTIFFLTLGLTGWLFVAIPKGFFPTQDTGLIMGLSEAAQDVSPEEMKRLQQELGAVIAQDPAVAAFGSVLGAGGANTTNNGRFFIALKPRDERDASAAQVINRLRPKLGDVAGAAVFLQPAQDITVGGRVSRALYQYTLTDVDLAELDTWAPKLLARLRQLPELTDVSSDQQGNAPQLRVIIDRDRAARFGIQPALIDATLNDAFGQQKVTQYFTQLNSYSVILEAKPDLLGHIATLDQIYVKSPASGQAIPLSTFVTLDAKGVGPLSVSHQAQFPAVTLSFNLKPGVSLGDAVNAINTAARSIGAPSTLTGGFQGNAQAFQSALASEPALIAAALFAVYVILGMLYESFVHPLTILSTLPSAGVGALLALWAGGFDLSVIGIIGIILLIGIVKKNGILLVDFAIVGERQNGLSAEEAIREACRLRFRPILMTTMAALLAGVPLMLGNGTGSELRQPLGYAMVGGLLLSQLLTLYTTPVVYLYLARLQGRFSRRRQARPKVLPAEARNSA